MRPQVGLDSASHGEVAAKHLDAAHGRPAFCLLSHMLILLGKGPVQQHLMVVARRNPSLRSADGPAELRVQEERLFKDAVMPGGKDAPPLDDALYVVQVQQHGGLPGIATRMRLLQDNCTKTQVYAQAPDPLNGRPLAISLVLRRLHVAEAHPVFDPHPHQFLRVRARVMQSLFTGVPMPDALVP